MSCWLAVVGTGVVLVKVRVVLVGTGTRVELADTGAEYST